jgi:hypothetical protein
VNRPFSIAVRLVAFLALSIVGCSEPKPYRPAPADATSARLIDEMGVHVGYSDGRPRLQTFVARDDFRYEWVGPEFTGKLRCRLTDEERDPLTFRAGMSPEDAIRAAIKRDGEE